MPKTSRRKAWLLLPLLFPAILGPVILIVGCGGDPDADLLKNKYPKRDRTGDDQNLVSADGAQAETLEAVKIDKTTTFTGVIKISGAEPDVDAMTAELRRTMSAKDAHCLRGMGDEISAYTWVINANKGVKNVFVWFKPETDNQFFDVENLVKQGKGFNKYAGVDQPHCAFVPHAQVVFPRYVNPANPARNFNKSAKDGGPPATGQEFKIKNSAPIDHNAAWGGFPTGGKETNLPVSKNGGMLNVTNINPSYRGPLTISCGIHPWMRSYVWAFDHPFAAVTDDDGKFKIENVPAGIKLRVFVWHEQALFVNKGAASGEPITLKEGNHELNFTISR